MIEQVIRLGRVQPEGQTGRPRPILLKLASKTEKWSELKNARKLKYASKDEFKKAIISPDLTVEERRHDEELRDKLWQRRSLREEGRFINHQQWRTEAKTFFTN